MPEVVAAGTELGALAPRHQKELDVGALRVIAPATHDTASAVAGTPLEPGWAYISSGTWSLVGVEREGPLLTAAAAAANLTNEVGAFGTVRLLKNVMGLWILETCRRELESAGHEASPTLLDRVAAVDAFPGVIFPDQPRFFNPRSMIAEVRASLEETGQRAPDDPVLLAKIILDSLALRYASARSPASTWWAAARSTRTSTRPPRTRAAGPCGRDRSRPRRRETCWSRPSPAARRLRWARPGARCGRACRRSRSRRGSPPAGRRSRGGSATSRRAPPASARERIIGREER